MEYRRMGRTGLRVSTICLGTMTFGFQTEEQAALRIMDSAWDAGVNFLDTSDVYPMGSEATGTTEDIVGTWLARMPRDRVVLATKCRGATGPGPNDVGLSRQHILSAVDASLKRLGTDYIDLYQTHFPDPDTPIDETLRALDDLVRSGKVRYIGCSNYQAWELARALGTSERLGIARYDCDQPRYNILYREIENELLPLCREEGVGIIAYNPLAGGMLTGKYAGTEDLREQTRFTLGNAGPRYRARYWDEVQFREVERLRTVLRGARHVADARGDRVGDRAGRDYVGDRGGEPAGADRGLGRRRGADAERGRPRVLRRRVVQPAAQARPGGGPAVKTQASFARAALRRARASSRPRSATESNSGIPRGAPMIAT